MLRLKFGTIIIEENGVMHLDCRMTGGDRRASKAEVLTAVRARFLEILSKEPGVAPLIVSEVPTAPVSPADERAAGMETYLLINRCQGNE